MMGKTIKPVHPGTILLEEFLNPMGISQYRLAKDIHVPARRVNEIIKGKRAVTIDTALRLALFFGMSPDFWLGLQRDYELDEAKQKLQAKLKKEVRPWANFLKRPDFCKAVG
jgi:addiction module HigA family antidote